MKFFGYRYNREIGWERFFLPKCNNDSFAHQPLRFHIGYYGPFEEAVGTCPSCKTSFKASLRQMDKQVANSEFSAEYEKLKREVFGNPQPK